MGTAVPFAWLPACLIVIALKNPTGRPALESGVSNQVCPSRRDDFHIVDQAFPRALKSNVQLVSVSPAVVHGVSRLDVYPRALGGFIAVRPIGRQPPVPARIPQLETAAAATRPLPPAPARAVGHFIDGHMNFVGH